MSWPSHVYVIGSATGPLKIGVANHVGMRLASLQREASTPLEALHVVDLRKDVAFQVEGHAHYLL